jgi:indolepyruvate ferredoxin oxidoreductase alpha subunit
MAVVGDSPFMHSDMNSLLNAAYNQVRIVVLILDSTTTAITGHQGNPGSGISPFGEDRVCGTGVTDVAIIDAFDLKFIRQALNTAVLTGVLSICSPAG